MYLKLYQRMGRFVFSVCALILVTAAYEVVAAPVSGGGGRLNP